MLHGKRYLWAIYVLMISFICLYVFAENDFFDSRYEIGNITAHEGYLFIEPVPALVQIDSNGDKKTILLVSYGKFGAEKDLIKWQETNGHSLNGARVIIRGTVAAYKDEIILEMTQKEHAINLIEDQKDTHRSIKHTGIHRITGEIVDPKCYFGAMKPGVGKIHKSCAIRCLSGGIPPVFVGADDKYYTLILPEIVDWPGLSSKVAKRIDLEGEVTIIDGMRYMKIGQKKLDALLMKRKLDSYLTMCASP